MFINYFVCVLLSIGVYLWLYTTDVKKSLSQNIMLIIMIISNLGYLFYSLSTNVSEALLANKIVYIGGCYIPMLYFFTVCEVCHFELKKQIKLPLLLFQTFIFVLVCTSDFSDLYYKSVEFSVVNGNVTLDKVYGPLHILYPLTLYTYFVVAIITAIRAILKNKTVNKHDLLEMLSFSALAILCYILQRVLELKVDIMSISYIILLTGTLAPLYHSNLYTASENKNIIDEQIAKVGFITFNKKFEYMGCNDKAAQIFPEIKKIKVGEQVKCETEALSTVVIVLKEYDEKLRIQKKNRNHDHKKLINLKVNDNFYDVEIHTINNYFRKIVGYTIQFNDVTEHLRIVELTSQYNETLTKEVAEKTNRILTIQEKTILGMAQMVESRDLSTGGHIKRTSSVVRIFAQKLLDVDYGLSKGFLDLVIRSAPMHDLGKIGVDDSILRKAGKFNDEEYNQMKKHAEIGGKMVNDILTGVEEDGFVSVAQNVAHYHHERVNGKGYPEGLTKDEIPIEARIMALADVFDALVSTRCYKEAFPYERAFEIIKADAGTHFDEDLTKVFLMCRPELENYYNQYKE